MSKLLLHETASNIALVLILLNQKYKSIDLGDYSGMVKVDYMGGMKLTNILKDYQR